MLSSPEPDLFDPAAYRLTHSVGYLLSRARAAMAHEIEQEIGELDITHAQATCLMTLAHERARTVTDLGRELGTDMGSVTRLLDRIEKRGLIRRQRSDTDRRIVTLSVTPLGYEMAAKLPAYFCRVQNRHFQGFTSEEIDTLRAMLLRVIGNGQACTSTVPRATHPLHPPGPERDEHT